MPKPCGDFEISSSFCVQDDDEISTSPHGLCVLYVTLLAENCQNLKMAAIGRNMYFFLVNKHHNLAIFYSRVF